MKVGVVGAGFWGRKHIEEYQRLSESHDVDLDWVVDPSVITRTEIKNKYGVRNRSASVDDMLCSDIDAVSVCVWNDVHYQVAKRCLEAGKSVLVEKPMTMTAKSSLDLVQIAKENDVTLAVGHVFRFNNAINAMKNLSQTKSFGEIFNMVARWTTLCESPPGRDVVFDLAPHAFDVMNYVLDEWPIRVTCTGRPYRRELLEESAFITAEFPSGRLGHIETSWLLPGKTRTIDLVGSKRAAHVDALDQTLAIHDGDSRHVVQIEKNNTIYDELKHFTDSVASKDSPVNSGVVGAKTVRCLQAAVTSMREKAPVDMEWDF